MNLKKCCATHTQFKSYSASWIISIISYMIYVFLIVAKRITDNVHKYSTFVKNNSFDMKMQRKICRFRYIKNFESNFQTKCERRKTFADL